MNEISPEKKCRVMTQNEMTAATIWFFVSADASTLLRQADVAMFVAKQGESGVVVYTTEQDHYSAERLALGGELRRALEGDELLLITQQGILIRFATADVRETGRAAQGVKLIDLAEGDRVVAVAKLVEKDEDGENGVPVPGPEGGNG